MPFYEDVAQVFESFASMPWAMYLDSGRPHSQYGRFDIITAFPKKTFVTRGRLTTITTGDNSQVVPTDPFALIQQEVKKQSKFINELPFTGGAVGYFSYDLGRRIERLPNQAQHDLDIPDLAVGIYHWAYVVDHKERKAFLVGDLSEPRVRLQWNDLTEQFTAEPKSNTGACFKVTSAVKSNMTETEYKQKFQRVKDYIGAGDCYQVNLAQRFSAEVEGNSWQSYKKLRSINPSPFSAYMHIPDCTILSASPERFIQVRKNIVETKPIKGTRPRSQDKQEDLRLQNELTSSIKDQAENVMIVDLLRNDLSKCCENNSVKVPKLFDLESFPTVHHLVSTITGVLPHDMNSVQLLRECFDKTDLVIGRYRTTQ